MRAFTRVLTRLLAGASTSRFDLEICWQAHPRENVLVNARQLPGGFLIVKTSTSRSRGSPQQIRLDDDVVKFDQETSGRFRDANYFRSAAVQLTATVIEADCAASVALTMRKRLASGATA